MGGGGWGGGGLVSGLTGKRPPCTSPYLKPCIHQTTYHTVPPALKAGRELLLDLHVPFHRTFWGQANQAIDSGGAVAGSVVIGQQAFCRHATHADVAWPERRANLTIKARQGNAVVR